VNIQSYLKPAHNRSLAKWRVMCFYDSLVVNQSMVLQLNFCANNPPLRQAAKRYVQAALNIQKIKIILTKST